MYARVSLDLEMYASEPSVGGRLIEAGAVGSVLLTDNPTNFGYFQRNRPENAENASFDAGNET